MSEEEERTIYPAEVLDNASIVRLMRLKVRQNVDGYGFHLQGVFGGDDPPRVAFTYTVGLIEKHDHPELVIFALDYDIAAQLLTTAVERIQRGERFVDGQRLEHIVANDLVLRCRGVPANRAPYRLSAARAFYERDDLPVLQLVLPDPNGRFPDATDCDPAFRIHQRVLW
jgi:hypothetical protein